MAQLKDLLVNGDARVLGTLYGNQAILNIGSLSIVDGGYTAKFKNDADDWGLEFIGENGNKLYMTCTVGSTANNSNFTFRFNTSGDILLQGIANPTNNNHAANKAYVDSAVSKATGKVTLNGTSTTTASFYAPTSAGTSGYVLKSNGSGAPTWTSAVLTDNKVQTAAQSSATIYVTGCTGATTGTLQYNTGVKIENSVLLGAAWNDYAEYRNQEELIEPGYCVKSSNSGKVSKTTEKYQACDGIVSDTFGFAIGQTETCQTPLAVAGRVLAYFEGNREDYQAGDTVCAGPNGKIMKMTREEIKEYPDRIIGLVSEIPEYETWGENNVPVNGRIWIKIK